MRAVFLSSVFARDVNDDDYAENEQDEDEDETTSKTSTAKGKKFAKK